MIETGYRKHELPDTHDLSSAARQALIVHRAELNGALQPAGPERAGERIGRMFQMFPVTGASAKSTEKLIKNYTKAVANHPLFAIDAACVQVQHSGADYRPSEPKFLKAVMDAAATARAEMLKVEDVLNAKVVHVPDEAERARVADKFKALRSKMFAGEQIVASGPVAPRAEEPDEHSFT